MRGVLRRRLQDPLEDPDGNVIDNPEWDDPELNELLNLALLEMETSILEINPLAFLSVDTFDIVAGQERYDHPPGFLYETDLSVADSSGRFSTPWRPLSRTTLSQSRLRVSGAADKYATVGRWFYLTPIPTVSANEALQLTWVYSLSMIADEEVPLIALPLHNAIVDMALIMALAETAEVDAAVLAQKRVDKAVARLPMWYRRTRGEPPTIQPSVRVGSRNRLPRDRYFSGG